MSPFIFQSDDEIPTQINYTTQLAGIARISQGKLTRAVIETILGADVNGRTNSEIRDTIIKMCREFPKET
jgi:hypothetical protein